MAHKGLSTVVTAMFVVFLLTPIGLYAYKLENPDSGVLAGKNPDNNTVPDNSNTGRNSQDNMDNDPGQNTGGSNTGSSSRSSNLRALFGWNVDELESGKQIQFHTLYDDDYDSYTWEFPSATYTGRKPTHTFDSGGKYLVNLTVELDGKTKTRTRELEVEPPNQPPQANITYSGDDLAQGKVINFRAVDANDPDGRVIDYYWDFGGGVSSGRRVTSHTFESNGTKTVKLIITDNEGLNATESIQIEIDPPNQPPVPEFVIRPEHPRFKETVVLNASKSYDTDGSVERYFWKVDDSNYTEANRSLTGAFSEPGIRNVSLKLIDNEGASANLTKSVNVSSNRAPYVYWSYSPGQPDVNQKVTFTSAAIDPDGEVVSYEWDLDGDGVYEAQGQKKTKYFLTSGVKNVSLKVTDNDKASNITRISLMVVDKTPTADFDVNAFVLRQDEDTVFDAGASTNVGDSGSYRWDWNGDGKFDDTGETEANAFSNPGEYDVTLEVTDGNGDRDTTTKRLKVVPSECQKLRITGSLEDKADILLVGRNYWSDVEMMNDFRYYMDFEQQHRGLFDVYPMNTSMDKFNVWVLDAGVGNIADYQDSRNGRGLVEDSRDDWFPKCPFADYKVVMSEDGFQNVAFTRPGNHEMFIPDVADKVEQGNGAVALIHEWGHGFAGLKDEYTDNNKGDNSGKPNCAPTREKAEEWWGDLAETNPNVGFERGCAYTDDNWEPHPGGTIMGDGGLWHYGPVNDRAMLQELAQYN